MLLLLFERQTIELFGWCSFSILFNFSEYEAFAGEALVLGEISFLILLSLVWTSDLFSLLTLKASIFIEDPQSKKKQTFPIGYFVYFYYYLTAQPIKCADLSLWEKYSFHLSDFNWSSNQTTVYIFTNPSALAGYDTRSFF